MASHKINITPDTSLFPTLGNTGYKFSEALAEFIDNSIDANTGSRVDIRIELNKDRLLIEDNAEGMSKEEFGNALKLAFVNQKEKQLGEFGLGMKTAAITLGERFDISTTKKESSEWLKYSFNQTEWASKKDWTAEIFEQLKEKKGTHGTKIEIKDFKFKFYPNLVTNTKKELAKRYARFISNNNVSIIINTDTIKPIEPQLMNFNGHKKNKLDIKLENGTSITGWYGFLVKRSSKTDYGFNLLKNNRVILENIKFGFLSHPEVALLVGEINLDFVPITHTKREFLTTSYEYRLADAKFKNFLDEKKILITARNITKKENKEKQIKKIKSDLEEVSKNMKLIGRINDDRSNIQSSLNIQTSDGSEKETLSIAIFDKKYTITFGIDSIGVNEGIAKLTDLSNNKIEILINSDFPYYKQVKDYPTYALLIISEQIARHFTEKNKKGNIFAIRDRILFEIGIANVEKEKQLAKQEKIKKLEEQLAKLKKKE